MQRWYVAHTHARSEAKAVFHLRRQRFGVYLPQYLKRTSHARKVEDHPAALFPGYLFVSLDPAVDCWRTILSTSGVADLIREGMMPLAVPAGVVEALLADCDEHGFHHLADGLASGARICVAHGPLAGLEGAFLYRDGPARVSVLLDLIGQGTRISLPSTAVNRLH